MSWMGNGCGSPLLIHPSSYLPVLFSLWTHFQISKWRGSECIHYFIGTHSSGRHFARHFRYTSTENKDPKKLAEEDGGKIGGSWVHFPSAPVKRLADVRNRMNSHWYSSIYEDQRPKIVEDIENQTVRRVLDNNKVPGTSTGTRAAEEPQ